MRARRRRKRRGGKKEREREREREGGEGERGSECKNQQENDKHQKYFARLAQKLSNKVVNNESAGNTLRAILNYLNSASVCVRAWGK